jgi:ABC-type branched-subunit amino acid transport system substrate-binding protein
LIGASLSLTGDFSADGQAFQRGYELWASDVNRNGGLHGRPVKLVILNDGSSPTTVVSDYQKLISVDHVNLTFGPFSSLLTAPAANTTARYRYALIMGAGTTDDVFHLASNRQVHNVFSPSLPVKDYLVPFANWIVSLPPGERPKTAAYPMADDPFAAPPVQVVQQILQRAGIRTVYSKVFPAEVSAYKGIADQVAASGADMVVLGSPDSVSLHAGVPAAALQPEGFRRRVRTGWGAAIPQCCRGGQRDRDHGAQRLVRQLCQPAEPRDGPGVHRQVRWHFLEYQRRRGRGVFGGRGRG